MQATQSKTVGIAVGAALALMLSSPCVTPARAEPGTLWVCYGVSVHHPAGQVMCGNGITAANAQAGCAGGFTDVSCRLVSPG